jgi:predicted ATP-grasp superfamily ATP-dependent carboligase
MPTISDPNVVRAIAREYIANGRNKVQALIEAGYKPSYARTVKGMSLYEKEAVKAAIAGYEADKRVDATMTVERVQGMYEEARQLAITNNQPSAAVSAVTGIARLYGMDKDTQTTIEQPEELDANQLDQARKQVKQLRLVKDQEQNTAPQAQGEVKQA